MRRLVRAALTIAGLALAASGAQAEPIFLSRQYTRCITCHYSPTGGGLLTPYGRSLSRQELSTTGRSQPGHPIGSEEGFLWGVLGKSLGPVQLGLDLRPAHLKVDFGGPDVERNFFMNADLLAAVQIKNWTLYGEVGRRPLHEGSEIDSYEYWVAHQSEKGFGFRVGRFLPAYGVRVADPILFGNSLVGSEGLYTASMLEEYLRSSIMTRLTDVMGETLKSLFDLGAQYDELSQTMMSKLGEDFSRFGLALDNFRLNAITPPEEVQQAIDQRSKMKAIGNLNDYTRMKAAEALGTAAANPGGLGSAGVGLGAGFGLGGLMAHPFPQETR